MFLITGASGFIGRNLCSRFDEEFRVITRKKIPDYKMLKNVFMIDNFITKQSFSDTFNGVHTIIHLSGVAHSNLKNYSNDFEQLNNINAVSISRFAEQAARNGIKRFVFISSIGVNGNSTSIPFSESACPNPIDSYAVSKLNAEKLLLQIGKSTGMEIVIIRPPMVYGLGAPGNFSNVIKLIHSNIPLPLGSITNLKSFIGINNLIDFIILCAKSPLAANELFLISDDHDISTPEFFKVVGEAIGKKIILFNAPTYLLRFISKLLKKESFFIKLTGNLQISPSKASVLLGWSPKYTINEELLNMRDYNVTK